jgi:hypothetical protein
MLRRCLLLGLASCGTIVPPTDTGSTTAGASTGTTADDATTTGAAASTAPVSTTAPASTSEASGQGSSGPLVPDFPPPEDRCDPYSPYSCPEGQKCTWSPATGNPGGDQLVCVPLVPDPKHAGEPCELEPGDDPGGADDCELGTFCSWYGALDQMPTCVPLCKGSLAHPYCEQGQRCMTTRTVAFCQTCCDPLLQDCGADRDCWLDGYGGSFCEFQPGQEVKPGDACESLSDCVLGSTCVPAAHVPGCEARFCCTELCRLGGAEPCSLPGQSCRPLDYEGESPCIADLGLCTLLEGGP